MTDDETPKSFDEHITFLSQHTNTVTKEVWSFMMNRVLEDGHNLDSGDVSYIVTGVCVGLFAHFNAVALVEGGETKEHIEKQMLENFNEWYKQALPDLVEQIKGKGKQND